MCTDAHHYHCLRGVTWLIPGLHTCSKHQSTNQLTLRPFPYPSRSHPRSSQLQHLHHRQQRLLPNRRSTHRPRCVFFSRHVCVPTSRSTRSIPGTALSWSLVSDPCSSRLSFALALTILALALSFGSALARLCQTRNLTLVVSDRPPNVPDQTTVFDAQKIQRFHRTSATSLRTHVTRHALHCTMHVHWEGLISGCSGTLQESVPAPSQPRYRLRCLHHSLSDRG